MPIVEEVPVDAVVSEESEGSTTKYAAVGVGNDATIGLKQDGTVELFGYDVYDVDQPDWTDIVAVAGGTVLAKGSNEIGGRDIGR